MDRLELNAQIQSLIESKGVDSTARRAIADFGLTLAIAKAVELYGTLTHFGGGKVSGHTPEHGTIEAEDKQRHTREFSRGTAREQVGYYKIWREPAPKKQSWIVIADFWKLDPETASETEESRQWTLALDTSGQPLWFGERGFRPVFRIPFGRAGALQVLKEVLLELWGPAPNAEHPRGYTLQLVIGQG